MLIANPIYDVVFKYLMKDKKVAKLLLSAIIGEEILELDFRPTEHNLELESWTVTHMDFSAKIRTDEGKEKLVIIEIQKAKLPSDIMRFRRYLGQQYTNKDNVVDTFEKGKTIKKALPIISIYFLGHMLDHHTAPVIEVKRNYYDLATREKLDQKENFIESLTHDSYVIQIPQLTGKRRTELEQILSVFDQDQATNDAHILNVQEEELPETYRPLLRRLIAACGDQKIRDSMTLEDEIVEDFKNLERVIEAQDKELKENKKALNEQDKELTEKDKELTEKDKELTEKDKELTEKDKELTEKDKLIEELKKRLDALE